jgi:ATP-dependent Clp protease ATP-binding subunit ClpA
MQDTGAAAQVLKSNNVTLEQLRKSTESIAELSTGWTPRQLPLTRKAVKILQAALSQAEALGQDRIETEHLLLAISRSDGGLAPQILNDLGVKIIAP